MTSDTATPAAVRRLDTPDARALADLAAIFEDLQTVLRCCERLVSELASEPGGPDDLTVEAYWTMAVLSYTAASRGEPAAPASPRMTFRRRASTATCWAGTSS